MSEPTNNPTDLLMKVMEDFGESEPESLLIVYTNKDGFLNWRSNNLSDSLKVGMMEVVKAAIFRNQQPERF